MNTYINNDKDYKEIINIDNKSVIAMNPKRDIEIDFNKNKENIFIELIVYDFVNNNILDVENLKLLSEEDSSIFILKNKILLNPGIHLRNMGYSAGKFKIKYSFGKIIFGSYDNKNLFIKEISPTKKELKIISNSDINIINNLNTSILNKYINVNNEKYLIINSHVKEDELYLKLYNNLSNNITNNDSLFIYEELLPSIEDTIVLFTEIKEPDLNLNKLRPANIDFTLLKIDNRVTPIESFDDIVTNNINIKEKIIQTYFSSSVYDGIQLNIDYRDFNNFIHYSSALQRINNFIYKINNIESYNSIINQFSVISGSGFNTPWTGSGYISSSVSSSIYNFIQLKTNEINSFDSFERFLYYESSSYESSSLGTFPSICWPKYTDYKPYNLYSISSSIAQTWISEFRYSASEYDRNNPDILINTIPSEIYNDIYNQDYVKFIKLSSHYLDVIYNYNKHITEHLSRNNSINEGIPKELIQHELNNYGIELKGGYSINDIPSFIYYTSSDGFNFSN